MKRRDFIKSVAPLAVVPFFSNKLFAAAYTPSVLDAETAFLAVNTNNDRVLVVVQLTGGNDGLNTIFPMDQYSNLMAARSNMLMPDTAPLVLGSSQTAIHPAMTGLKSLFDEQKLTIVQNVGYASPNFSHFRATDIWNTGSNSTEILSTGWAARYLEYAFPGYPDAYPSTAMPDPLAVQIGSNLSLGLQGNQVSTGQTVPTSFNGNITSLTTYRNATNPGGNMGTELSFLRDQQLAANQYAQRIVATWNAGTNQATYAATSSSNIAQQLKIVARLIKGGLKTKIFWVSIGSFDTHANQVVASDKTTGTHANLLRSLSDAIRAFQTDLQLMGLEDRVVGLTYSEFGRRVRSNGSIGTDHGTASPMFVFGSKVNGGIIGSNPVIPASTTTSTQVAMEFDYRSIYASVLQNWFCVPQAQAETILGNNAISLNNFQSSVCSEVLPIELSKFSVEKANKADAHLEWITANESNTSRYDIERSTDGKQFAKVGEMKAAGHSHVPTRYDFLDKNLPLSTAQIFYYRLKINDLDGTSTFTEVRSIAFERVGNNLAADIFPNPSTNGKCQLILRGGIQEDILTEISISDLYGRQVMKQTAYLKMDTVFDLDFVAAAGI